MKQLQAADRLDILRMSVIEDRSIWDWRNSWHVLLDICRGEFFYASVVNLCVEPLKKEKIDQRLQYISGSEKLSSKGMFGCLDYQCRNTSKDQLLHRSQLMTAYRRFEGSFPADFSSSIVHATPLFARIYNAWGKQQTSMSMRVDCLDAHGLCIFLEEATKGDDRHDWLPVQPAHGICRCNSALQHVTVCVQLAKSPISWNLANASLCVAASKCEKVICVWEERRENVYLRN